MELHYEILDPARRELAPLFRPFKDRFYLAGGTALALQIGHRDSVDFDFFTGQEFTPESLAAELENIFSNRSMVVTQSAKDTLSVVLDGQINLSFFYYPYPLVGKLVEEENFNLASVEDIGVMKLIAIVSRSVLKDYVDLYYIFKKISLPELLTLAGKKTPMYPDQVVLKSLVYFDELADEPLKFMPGFEVSREELSNFFTEMVKEHGRKND